MRHRDDEDRAPTIAEQLDGLPLLQPPPVHELARAHDPSTSKQAAVDAQDSIIAAHQALILEALTTGPFTGLTPKEIARAIYAATCVEINSVQVTRRIHELRKQRLVMTLDGLGKDPKVIEWGHSTYSEERERCAVVVLADHHQNAVDYYQRRDLAERISA